jgi:hypothetical protein
MKIILITMFLTVTSFAQTAKVIQLSPEDAAEAKSLYEQKAAIEQKIEAMEEKVATDYLEDKTKPAAYRYCVKFVGDTCVQGGPKDVHYPRRDGWESGFEFSVDFKFIVPKKADALPSGNGSFQRCMGGQWCFTGTQLDWVPASGEDPSSWGKPRADMLMTKPLSTVTIKPSDQRGRCGSSPDPETGKLSPWCTD